MLDKPKCVFISNFYNHHQGPFSESMSRLTNGRYYFIETTPINDERVALGWGEHSKPSFVKRFYESDNAARECRLLIDDAEFVVMGSAPVNLIKNRQLANKPTFCYSERTNRHSSISTCNLLKRFKWCLWTYPIRQRAFFRFWRQYKNSYLLGAGAYVAADFIPQKVFQNRAYQWGYFPAIKKYENPSQLFESKSVDSILWCGRFLDLKHPEAALYVAQKLKNAGYRFKLDIIGNGVLEESVKRQIEKNNLSDQVRMLGSMPPEDVRRHMEKAGIFLFTSDFYEGWGAVLNESMNSGCAVVASHAIGSVPCLIKNRENGLIFKNQNWDDLYERVKYLLDNPDEQQRLGNAAYRTMTDLWSPEIAAERLLNLMEDLCQDEKSERYADGPCSCAHILKNDWFVL